MITEYTLRHGAEDILIEVRRSGRKSMCLEVKQSKKVLARIPAETADAQLKQFIEGHREWIIEKSNFFERKDHNRESVRVPPMEDLKKDELEEIKRKISGRVSYYGNLMGVTWGRITIRNQKTRWGSCSTRGNLNFNYRLYYLREDLLDYVVVHELAHRRYMNHSHEFWREVERYFPDYRECRRRLKECIMQE